MNKKSLLAVLIFIFVIALTFFIRIKGTDESIISESDLDLNNQANNPASSQPNNPEDNPPLPETISQAQLAEHDSNEDCWVVYQDKVYDVTSFLPNHPGSAGAISPHCGTLNFETAFTNKHGTSKANMLMQVGTFIGDFDVVGNA